MNNFITQLHNRALTMAHVHRKSESDLIGVLQQIDEHRAYLHFGARSLYDYCERILGLSEGTSYNLITVARRAKEVPALKRAVESGKISVSKARKIAPVLNRENQDAWLAIAETKSSREIEREVAKVNPQAAQAERFQYTNGETIRTQLDIPESLMKKLRRIQDLESQRRAMASTFVETLEAAADVYLERNDPVVKAERALAKRPKNLVRNESAPNSKENSGRNEKFTNDESAVQPREGVGLETQRDGELVPGRVDGSAIAHDIDAVTDLEPTYLEPNDEPVPARSKHLVYVRTGGRCTHTDVNGRCTATRWLHIHHIVLRSDGGSNEPENLTLLCEPHHRMAHLGSRVQSPTLGYRAS